MIVMLSALALGADSAIILKKLLITFQKSFIRDEV
jgi:hypothetical protein